VRTADQFINGNIGAGRVETLTNACVPVARNIQVGGSEWDDCVSAQEALEFDWHQLVGRDTGARAMRCEERIATAVNTINCPKEEISRIDINDRRRAIQEAGVITGSECGMLYNAVVGGQTLTVISASFLGRRALITSLQLTITIAL